MYVSTYMKPHFETDAVRPTDHAPLAAYRESRFGSKAEAETTIAAVWQTEADRLYKRAFRILHKTDGVDIEGVVSDALVQALERWDTIRSIDTVAGYLHSAVRTLALMAIRSSHDTTEVNDRLADPSSKPATSPGTDTSVAWLLDLCADETERRILTIWMAEGNQTSESVAEATKHWLARWTPLEVRQLFARLRKRMGIHLASMPACRFTTKGTLPGHGHERYRTVYALTLLFMGPRPLDPTERMAARHMVPTTRMDALGNWQSGMEVVYSTR